MLSVRIPRSQTGNVSFQWRGHDVLQLNADVGLLGVLPLEILHQILHQLDIVALARLQCVSRGIKLSVGSLPMLRTLRDLAPETIRDIAVTKTGSLIVCHELYAKFCQPFYDTCPQAGSCLYLLTCKRVCLDCLTKTFQYRPLRPRQATYLYSLGKGTARSLPSLTVPSFEFRNVLTPLQGPFRRLTGWRLVDHPAVMDHAIRAHGSVVGIWNQLQRKRAKARRERRRRPLENVPHQAIPDVGTSFACAVAFPWIDRGSSTVGAPVLCTACMQSGMDPALYYFTKVRFKEHEKVMGKVSGGNHLSPTS